MEKGIWKKGNLRLVVMTLFAFFMLNLVQIRAWAADFTIEDGIVTGYTGSSTDVEIPSGVTGIGEGAFKNHTKIKKVTIPMGVTSIGKEAFSGCSALCSVEFPQGLKEIGVDALLLFTVDFPQGIFVRFLHENPGQQCAKCDRRKHLCAFCCYEQRSCE